MPLDTPSREFQQWIARWEKNRDAFDGGDPVKNKGTLHLPKPAGMDEDQYRAYRHRAKWYDAPERTINALVGMVLRREADRTLPRRIETHLENVTLTGLSLSDFQIRLFQEVLLQGRYGVEMDFTPPGAQEQRPIWSGFRAEQIRRVDTRLEGGREVVWRIVLREEMDPEDEDNNFSDNIEVRYRELKLLNGIYQWQAFQEVHDGTQTILEPIDDPVIPLRNNQPLSFIPFQFFGAKMNTPGIMRSPTEGVIDMAYAYYRHSADFEHGLHLTALPTAIITGHEDRQKEYLIGALTAWQIPQAEAKVYYLEYHGQGLDAIKDAMDTDKQEMATLGTRFLEMAPSVQETLGAVRLRHGADEGNLAMIAGLVGEGLQNVLRWHAWWNSDTDNLNDPSITYAFHTDFLTVPIIAQDMQTLWQMVQERAISYETFYWNMQQGERIPPDHDVEKEQALIDIRAPASVNLETEIPALNGNARGGV